jgi:hypothetical protein
MKTSEQVLADRTSEDVNDPHAILQVALDCITASGSVDGPFPWQLPPEEASPSEEASSEGEAFDDALESVSDLFNETFEELVQERERAKGFEKAVAALTKEIRDRGDAHSRMMDRYDDIYSQMVVAKAARDEWKSSRDHMADSWSYLIGCAITWPLRLVGWLAFAIPMRRTSH